MKTDFKKVRNVGFILALFPAVITAIISYCLKLTWADTIATAALGYAVLAFIGIWYTLWFTYAQLEKALAKPKLEISFNENGGKECVLNYLEGKIGTSLWVANKGNAITDLFQIDIYIPKVFKGGLKLNIVNLIQYHENKDYLISSFINNHYHICFIDRPIILSFFEMKIRPDIEYEKEYEISYKIYGDWKEPQEGKLKVIVNKQEVSHASTG